jgi:hypothetical protein
MFFDSCFYDGCFGVCTLATTGTRYRQTEACPDPQDRPVNAYYLFSEAHLDLRKGNLDGAIENMQQALMLDPDRSI